MPFESGVAREGDGEVAVFLVKIKVSCTKKIMALICAQQHKCHIHRKQMELILVVR